jgi:hypothetical protein
VKEIGKRGAGEGNPWEYLIFMCMCICACVYAVITGGIKDEKKNIKKKKVLKKERGRDRIKGDHNNTDHLLPSLVTTLPPCYYYCAYAYALPSNILGACPLLLTPGLLS